MRIKVHEFKKKAGRKQKDVDMISVIRMTSHFSRIALILFIYETSNATFAKKTRISKALIKNFLSSFHRDFYFIFFFFQVWYMQMRVQKREQVSLNNWKHSKSGELDKKINNLIFSYQEGNQRSHKRHGRCFSEANRKECNL